MIYIENNLTNPYYNLALEEYFLDSSISEDILLLWQNENTVVVGRYQNTAQEVNEQFCRVNNVRIVRRNTGGGAVYHDSGNLNFSIITDYQQGDDISFGRFSGVILETLRNLGVDARLKGRNDLVVENLKISGSAQTIRKGRILHHGTLLCCSDLDMISGALQKDHSQKDHGQYDHKDTDQPQSHLVRDVPGQHDSGMFDSKAVISIRSKVANIQDFNNEVSVGLLKSSLLSGFAGSLPLKRHELTAADISGIHLLQNSKYDTWQWNYGESPAFNFSKKTRFPQGTVVVSLIVEEGTISQCAINGDFLGCMDISDIERALIGSKMLFADVAACIARFDAGLYFGGISADDIANCFFD